VKAWQVRCFPRIPRAGWDSCHNVGKFCPSRAHRTQCPCCDSHVMVEYLTLYIAGWTVPWQIFLQGVGTLAESQSQPGRGVGIVRRSAPEILQPVPGLLYRVRFGFVAEDQQADTKKAETLCSPKANPQT
jgi:hypothetical protein